MPTGLKVPVGVGKSGGAAIESNESEQMKKLLFLALSEGDDSNPFQKMGLSGDLVFAINSTAFRGKAERQIQQVIQKFSDRIALAPDTAITLQSLNDGEVELAFEYVDLLTNKVEEFRDKFGR